MRKLALATALTLGISTAALAQEKDWNFGDGVTDERWSLQNIDYALCDVGLNQSPIDLGTPNARGNVELSTMFGTVSGEMALGEEKVQVDFVDADGKGMKSGGTMFNLVQVHFHTPSEHAIDGKRFPLVAHFVHATDDGRLGVLGVMFEEGRTNPGLSNILEAHASGDGTPVTFDIDTMVPDDLDVYRYMGSLTTPPCSEGVNWHVADTQVEASAQQIAALRGALGPTARSLQPQGSRLVVAPSD
ncbi:carbonic anhydrase [Pelagerythrobacter aerophilus]|uniref:carbonic anhydrase n=1 Tax=Pelagerythrobacter aerophilus TaxID=2306995 RepID=A0A418NKW1_9SPHN|nr:carbonic anhydrase family protein [Pelagerythrobacter aerophilus]RIV79979.1 carbonic anhydrase family protein [Pelagerythrobacter aerophilus]